MCLELRCARPIASMQGWTRRNPNPAIRESSLNDGPNFGMTVSLSNVHYLSLYSRVQNRLHVSIAKKTSLHRPLHSVLFLGSNSLHFCCAVFFFFCVQINTFILPKAVSASKRITSPAKKSPRKHVPRSPQQRRAHQHRRRGHLQPQHRPPPRSPRLQKRHPLRQAAVRHHALLVPGRLRCGLRRHSTSPSAPRTAASSRKCQELTFDALEPWGEKNTERRARARRRPAAGLCEATAGSVVLFRIPRESELYGFAYDERGYLKIGYRGTKYTNPTTQDDGKERSTPVTRWSEGEKLTQLPRQAVKVIRDFVDEYLPELEEEGIEVATTRVCWYTDSFDNHLATKSCRLLCDNYAEIY